MLIAASVMLCAALLFLARRATPAKVRRVGMVAVFACIGVAGYAEVGFLSAPGVAFAISVALAGLLLGRTAMLVTTTVTGALVVLLGTFMVRGVLPAPASGDISPLLARTWLRSAGVMMLLIIVLGATVTWAVQAIEAALVRVDREARRRQEAERQVLVAQRRELIVQLAAAWSAWAGRRG